MAGYRWRLSWRSALGASLRNVRERQSPPQGSLLARRIRPTAGCRNADVLPTCQPPTLAHPPQGDLFGSGLTVVRDHRGTCPEWPPTVPSHAGSRAAVSPSAIRTIMKPPPPILPAVWVHYRKRKMNCDCGVNSITSKGRSTSTPISLATRSVLETMPSVPYVGRTPVGRLELRPNRPDGTGMPSDSVSG